MNTPLRKYTNPYTPEKLAELTYSDLLDIKEKGIKHEVPDLVSMCDFEMSKRPPLPKAPFKTSSTYEQPNHGRSQSVVETDKQTSLLLAEAILDIDKKYDLSKETAEKLSEGTPRFIAHNLLAADGRAKVGGARMKGRVAISNFVSYRLKNNVFALCIVLEHNKLPSATKYIVLAPQEYLKNFTPIDNLIPMEEDDNFGLVHGGEEFKSYDEALDSFTKIIEKVAPKRLN